MRKKELTICSNPSCGVEFLKDKSELNRNEKIGRKNYCSLKCSGINNHLHLSNFVKKILNISYRIQTTVETNLQVLENTIEELKKDPMSIMLI